jgi:hypothetical protein
MKILKTKKRWFLSLELVLVGAIELGCGSSSQPKVEAVPSPVTVAEKQQQMAKLPPPELNEVQQALKRVFKDSATIDTSRQPPYIAADFNGDLSQDVAIIVKPAPGKAAEMNESPTWLLRDPFKPTVPGEPAIKIEDDDVLLAIIHGFGTFGWRDSQATQTYVLRNAVGPTLSVEAGKAFVSDNAGKPLPRIHGDLIKEVLGGTAGFLYYAGPTYSWYDPKTFKGETQAPVGHGRKLR